MTATAVAAIADDQVNVPCGTCRLCCRRQSVPIMPDLGDDPTSYQCHPRELPDGTVYFEIDHKPNGDCVYLDENGCSIHGRAPYLCRTFDCRAAFRMHSRQERRRRIAQGRASAEVYAAGRERLKSLR